MQWFFDLLDVVPAVRAATAWAKGMRGPDARIAFFSMLFFVDPVLAWLTWFFDIEPTMQYSRAIHVAVMATLAESLLVYGPLILIVITIAPTAMRQTFAGMVGKYRALASMIIILNLFDARTDWPRVKEVMSHPLAYDMWSWANFDGTTMIQDALWGASRILLLLAATDLFEIFLVASIVSTFILAANMFRGQSAATGSTTKLQNP